MAETSVGSGQADESIATVRGGGGGGGNGGTTLARKRTGIYRDQSAQVELETQASPAKRPRLEVPEDKLPTLPSLHLTPPEKKKSFVSEVLGDDPTTSAHPSKAQPTKDKGKGKEGEEDPHAAVERAQQAALALGELFSSGGVSARNGKKSTDVGTDLAKSFIPLNAQTAEGQKKDKKSEQPQESTSQPTHPSHSASEEDEQSSSSSESDSSEESSSSSEEESDEVEDEEESEEEQQHE